MLNGVGCDAREEVNGCRTWLYRKSVVKSPVHTIRTVELELWLGPPVFSGEKEDLSRID